MVSFTLGVEYSLGIQYFLTPFGSVFWVFWKQLMELVNVRSCAALTL